MARQAIKDETSEKKSEEHIIAKMNNQLDRKYGFGFFKVEGDTVLGIRIPRVYAYQFTGEDNDEIVKAMYIDLERENLEDVTSVYIVADKSSVEIDPNKFFSEIETRKREMEHSKNSDGNSDIIIGVSREEFRELVAKYIGDGYRVIKGLEIIDGSGMTYDIDLVGVGEKRVMMLYMERVSSPEIEFFKTLMDKMSIDEGIVATNTPCSLQADNIRIMTVEDL